MKGLTEKQRYMLDFIENFQEKEGMSPTVYEIAEQFKIKTSTVFAHIRALQRKSFLVRSSKARSISLTKPKRKPRHMSFVLPIPLLGRINAGLPAESIENVEGEVFCDIALTGDDPKKVFALKIQGESMRDAGILEGDTIIIKQDAPLKAGAVVVALVNNETTVKSYYPRENSQIELRPANSDFKPQIYPAEQVKIQGVVLALQRKF